MAEDRSTWNKAVVAPEPNVSLDEILQEPIEDHKLTPVPVIASEALVTHELPSKHAACWTDSVTSDKYIGVVGGSKKHKRIVICAIDEDMVVSFDGMSTGMVWPKSVPLELQNTKGVHVKADGDAAVTRVSVLVESWAD